jgi:hypothetical protein
MSDADAVRRFVVDTLTDVGATVSEADSISWVQIPDAVRADLEAPARFAITFDPEKTGQFDAELIAPGSYFLEKILTLATRRGRWDVARCQPPDEGWIGSALSNAGLGVEAGVEVESTEIGETMLALLSFRVTLVADEKREQFHLIAVCTESSVAWEVDPQCADSGLVPAPDVTVPLDLQTAYHLGTDALRAKSRSSLDEFRAANLHLFEEEVRRIFGYFDRTIEEIRAADPEGSQDLLRAIQGERDRRLSETLQRFDPVARASLCAIRAILAPTARVRLRLPDGARLEGTVDAWSRHLGGVACHVCGGTEGPWTPMEAGVRCPRCASRRAESARPQDRPRSDILRRGRRAARGSARSPRGSKARSRAASAPRRGP